MSMPICSALSHSASNALCNEYFWKNLSLQQATEAGDVEVWIGQIIADQPWQTHNGHMCRAVFLARQVGGGWPNESAVIRWFEWRPACTARTGSTALGYEDTYALTYRASMWPNLPHRDSAAQHDGAVSDCCHISLCHSPLMLQRSWLAVTFIVFIILYDFLFIS